MIDLLLFLGLFLCLATAPGPGFYENIPFVEYFKWPYLNNTGLKEFEISPAQYAYSRAHPKPPTDPMIKGSAGDCLAFDSEELFERDFIILPPGMRRDMRVAAYRDFLKVAGDQLVITQQTADEARVIAKNFRAHPQVAPLLEAGQAQLTLVWDCPVTKVRCKGRLDNYAVIEHPITLDMKVTEAWRTLNDGRKIIDYSWHKQAYWYTWGASTLHKFWHDDYRLGCVQPKPPHIVRVHRLRVAALELARAQTEPLVKQFDKCQQADKWPVGYTDLVETDVPHWEYSKGEQA